MTLIKLSNNSRPHQSFLFLQGVCSPFFSRLADRLAAEGHSISKINFNGGDTAYWGKRPAWPFRGRVAQFAPFLTEKIHSAGITDIILFGDRRPLHSPAVELAKKHGVKIHVFEEGYFRPHWVTLEREGVNAHSLLPRDPDWYRHNGSFLTDLPQPKQFHSPFRVRAVHDLQYHLASMANPLFFPGYRTHSPYTAPVMYAGYIRRFALRPKHERVDAATINKLITSHLPYYLLPLQLNSDAQIRDHSDFEHMTAVIEFVTESFAVHAPPDSHLVIKNHPLDMGLINYPRVIKKLEQRFGVVGRIDYLETGNLELLVMNARGTVTVNSTVGGVALQFNCPTITLSDPIYNLPGLTFQGELDHFWQEAVPPDPELFRCFKATVIRTTQVNGGFYCDRGIDLAVENAVAHLITEKSPLEELL
jgi:capsular polysaccharide export protein